MRARAYIAAAVLLAAAISVSAQEKDTSSDTKYSVEIGTGLQPLHTNLANGWSYKKELAETGQGIDSKGSFCPVADLTAVIRTRPRTEFTLSAGVSWYHHRVIRDRSRRQAEVQPQRRYAGRLEGLQPCLFINFPVAAYMESRQCLQGLFRTRRRDRFLKIRAAASGAFPDSRCFPIRRKAFLRVRGDYRRNPGDVHPRRLGLAVLEKADGKAVAVLDLVHDELALD